MLTKELAMGMMRQANSGEQMLAISDAIASMMEEQNIEDCAQHFEQLDAEADVNFGQEPDEYQDAYAPEAELFPADQADLEAEMFAQQA
jgi:hypothetical protein